MVLKRPPPPPSRLSGFLSQFNAGPRLELPSLRSLRITFASRNDHFGARHFVKHELPRIRWANPDLQVELLRQPKSREDHWRPEMLVQLANDTTHSLNLQDKWSTTILKELVDLAVSVQVAKSVGKTKQKIDTAGLASLPADKEKLPPAITQLLPAVRDERQRYPTWDQFERTKLARENKDGVAAALP